jgi:DNA-binding transcriptional LysR family regulator
MRVTLDDLPSIALFARVVQLRSFTEAAAEAGLAKAAVSQRISRLEARLGVQLLRRSTRKLSLTDDGMRLFEHAATLVDVTRAADEALAAGQAVRGTVKLEAPASLHRATLAAALKSFLVRYPDVSLRVTLDDRLTDLVEGDFDVVLRVIAEGRRTSVARKLMNERVVVVGTPEYLDAMPPVATPYDLVHHSCLRNSSMPVRIDWRLSAGRETFTVPIHSRFECGDFALLYDAALAGMGLLVTLATTVEADLRTGRLRQVLDEYTSEPLALFAFFAERAPAHSTQAAHSPHTKGKSAARALVDHLAKTFREAPGTPIPHEPLR